MGRRGIVATTLAGNAPDIDIMAFANGKTESIQVKAQKEGKGNPGLDANKYLEIEIDEHSHKQRVLRRTNNIDRELLFVLVKFGSEGGTDEFFIFTQGVLQDQIYENYEADLKSTNYIKPKNWRSTHCSYYLDQFLQFKNNWELITSRLGFDQNLLEILQYLSKENRICPVEPMWDRFCRKIQVPDELSALILKGWSHSTDQEKQNLFHDQIRYSFESGNIELAKSFIEELEDNDWHKTS